jgi:hypothetical protein
VCMFLTVGWSKALHSAGPAVSAIRGAGAHSLSRGGFILANSVFLPRVSNEYGRREACQQDGPEGDEEDGVHTSIRPDKLYSSD